MEYMSVYGAPRTSRSTAARVVMVANTYDQLEQHLASFLASNEHKLLWIGGQDDAPWRIGVPSAVRRAVRADPDRRAHLGKVIWVRLPYERLRGWTLRTVQRRVAEGVLGVDAARELMDGADEDDDYSGVEVGGRGVVGGVSDRIAEELARIGRFLLVIENWWEAYSPELVSLGIPPPLPSRWSSQVFKLIVCDTMSDGLEGVTPIGEPTANAWLFLKQPASMDDQLTYIYREAVDLAANVVLNSDGGVDDAPPTITPQDVLDCLLFTSATLLANAWMAREPFRLSRSELVQFWVQNGLIMTNSHGRGRRAASEDDMINTAEALLEVLIHRRMLVLLYGPDVEAVEMMLHFFECLWDSATFTAPQGWRQAFQPRKFIIWRDGSTRGDLKEPESVEFMSFAAVWDSCKQSPLDDALRRDDGGGPKYAKLRNLRTLVHHGLSSFPAGDFFLNMDSLRVLIICKADVSSLPNSLFSLPNLRMLLVRECHSLTTFFVPGAPTTALYGLRVLDLSSSVNIPYFPDEAFAHMHSLQELRLRSSHRLNIFGGHVSYFKNMHTLRVLDISSNRVIESLPGPLVMAAPNLRRLLLSDCSHLETLTPHLYSHSTLEELDLRSCSALRAGEIEFKMPMLKLIRLSGSPAIRHLSFKGCSKLEVAELHALYYLESLDLSGTAIKVLDLRTFPSKSLVFLAATNLRTFPWKMMKQVPEELILEQHMIEATNCSENAGSIRRQPYGGGRGVLMHVRDGRFFRTLCDPEKGTDSELESFSTQGFYINIAPSGKRHKKEGNVGEFARRFPRQYSGMHQVCTKILPKQSSLCRHVEIQESHASPRDIHGFLKNTLSLSVTSQNDYKSLSELTPIGSVVRRCNIEKCHGMESIFVCSADTCLLQSLESVWASELRKAASLVVEKGGSFNWSQGFTNLKHVHLEFCPRLKYVFPLGARQGLQSLEVLEILFCPNLKEVFASPCQESQQAMSSSSSRTIQFAPHLRIVRLIQLPSLVSICHEEDKHWPALERFMVRGCWRLRKLPFLAYNESIVVAASASASASSFLPTAGTVTIEGEPVWWNSVLQGGGAPAKYKFHFVGIDVPLPIPK